ncbi:hypothetical protein GCM10010912_10700 [Paenibacillus albidus]|uniref:Uncharacterized protein n=1 Tax=Paenibacillus albidus TaxID=2041023 RepID=A0A917FDG8_9BACL|nr:hypothetical protein GCM10010912_10700 [Paenibacillus albidus]
MCCAYVDVKFVQSSKRYLKSTGSQRFASENIFSVACIERSLVAGHIDLFPNLLGIVQISHYFVQHMGGNAIIFEKATLYQYFDSLNIGLIIMRIQ